MSIPLSECLKAKAAKGDEKAYHKYSRALKFNLEEGHFCFFPCTCKPKCNSSVTKKQLQALENRLKVDVYDRIGLDDDEDNFISACEFCYYFPEWMKKGGTCKQCVQDENFDARCKSWRYYKDAELLNNE